MSSVVSDALLVEVGQFAGQLVIGIRVDIFALVRACQRDAVQRRHGGIHVAVFDKRPHVPVEQRQQQDTDMSTVHISIGHHDDLVIARLFDVEALAGAGTHHWMMAAHSLLESICVIDAFCTFRILPRIGSSAWKPALRAAGW